MHRDRNRLRAVVFRYLGRAEGVVSQTFPEQRLYQNSISLGTN